MLYKLKNNLGLTLIETTISLGLLMIGVMASVTLMLASFNRVEESEQEIVIVNLAREGLEIIRSMRNNENLADLNDVNIFDGTYDNTYFYVDRNTPNTKSNLQSVTVASGANVADCATCVLYLKNGTFVHDPTGTPTAYKRLIGVKNVSSVEKRITSSVAWTLKGKTRTYKLETTLTDWQ